MSKKITILNIDEFTDSEVIEFVRDELLHQGERSSNEAYRCKYRIKLEDGSCLRCAVGVLIPDDLYSESIEEKNVVSVLRELKISSVSAEKVRLLGAMQNIHDHKEIEDWENYFNEL